MANRKILHKRTSGSTPTSSMLSYGEIAMNYGANKEALYIKSSKDKIVEFKTDDYNEQNYLLNDNSVFTTFETEAEYNAAIANGEIVAPNTSYIVETNKTKMLSLIEEVTFSYNMQARITAEWLINWDKKMTSQGCEYIYLCAFFNDRWSEVQTDGWENMSGLTSDNITSFVVNGVERRSEFVTVPGYVNLSESLNFPQDDMRVGYAIPRSEVNAGDVFDIYMEITCEPFNHDDSFYHIMAYLDLAGITPITSINFTQQMQELVKVNGENGGVYLPHYVQEIKYTGDCSISIKAYTDPDYQGFSYLPENYVEMGKLSYVSGLYTDILKNQERIGIKNPTLTVYLPKNNPTYGSPTDKWVRASDTGKTMWGVHNHYAKDNWTSTGSSNLVAWKPNYTFKVVGYNDETYEG